MKKYNLFKNSKYAIEGFLEVLKNETAFKLQIFLFVLQIVLVIIIPFLIYEKFLIIAAATIPLITEIVNSSIERVVDLVTDEYNQLAKYAKDAASAAVMISFLVPIFVWIAIILKDFY